MEHDAIFVSRYAFAMLSQWLQQALKASKLSQAELARKLTEILGRSVDRAAVNKMASGTRGIAADEMRAIERLTGWEAPIEIEVPLKGYVGAGEAVMAIDQGDAEYQTTVTAPRDTRPGTIAAKVKGDSMFPTLRDGWTIYWSQLLPPNDLLNDLCVVHLADERILVKVLRAGSRPDLWTLQSVNATVADMVDQVVNYVSPIDWIKPR